MATTLIARNLFAEHLDRILRHHGKTLSTLYTLKSPYVAIPPAKVSRLKLSLHDDFTALLNAAELEMLLAAVPLDAQSELPELKAAILAETIRHLLAARFHSDYLALTLDQSIAARNTAYQLGQLVYQLFTTHHLSAIPPMLRTIIDSLRQDEEDQARSAGTSPEARESEVPEGKTEATEAIEATNAAVEHALAHAIDLYFQGAMWLEVARDTEDESQRQGLLALAKTLLHQAQQHMQSPPPSAAGTPLQGEWLAIIHQTLQDPELPSLP